MRIAGIVVRSIGWLVLLVPPGLFLGFLAYAYVSQPADQTGWGALIGALLILNMVTAPAGLLVLLLGYAFGWLQTEHKVADPPA